VIGHCAAENLFFAGEKSVWQFLGPGLSEITREKGGRKREKEGEGEGEGRGLNPLLCGRSLGQGLEGGHPSSTHPNEDI